MCCHCVSVSFVLRSHYLTRTWSSWWHCCLGHSKNFCDDDDVLSSAILSECLYTSATTEQRLLECIVVLVLLLLFKS